MPLLEDLFSGQYTQNAIFRILDRGLDHALEDAQGSPKRGDEMWGGDAQLYDLLMTATASNGADLTPKFLESENVSPEQKEWWREWVDTRIDRINLVLSGRRAKKALLGKMK